MEIFPIWCKNYQMEHQYSDRIVRLLQLYLLGDITEEERQELEDWCEEAPRNRKLFEQICQEDLFSKERYVYEKINECFWNFDVFWFVYYMNILFYKWKNNYKIY